MTLRGKVKDGVIVLEGGASLPDGTEVTISAPAPSSGPDKSVEEMKQKLLDLLQRIESEPCDLPSDLAENHDHYLYGLPKRSTP